MFCLTGGSNIHIIELTAVIMIDMIITAAQNFIIIYKLTLRNNVPKMIFFKTLGAKNAKQTNAVTKSIIKSFIFIPFYHKGTKNGIINAKTPKEMMSYTDPHSGGVWGKLPYNIGLPPYHFRCRTQIVPVWVDEMSLDDKTMRYTDFDEKKEVLSHIDKTGVQRKLKKSNTHIFKKHDVRKKDIISALNSITQIAPHKKFPKRSVAISQNGYYMVFEGTDIVTIYKPKNTKEKNNLVLHFKKNAILDKKEIIKWISMKSIFTGIMSGK